jgi:hypothetical protein
MVYPTRLSGLGVRDGWTAKWQALADSSSSQAVSGMLVLVAQHLQNKHTNLPLCLNILHFNRVVQLVHA